MLRNCGFRRELDAMGGVNLFFGDICCNFVQQKERQ